MATPELMINDVIGGSFFFEGITARAVNEWLAKNKGASEILVRINSPGGDAAEGVAIHAALKRSNARVIVEVEGVAASSASIVALAGDEIRMHKGSLLMWHEAHTAIHGRASDFASAAKYLETVNAEMADLYSARTGIDRERVLEMMAETTWLGADDAKAIGACDVVIAAKAAPPKSTQAAAMLLSTYRNVPSHLAAALQTMPPPAVLVDVGAQRAEEPLMDEKQILSALGVASIAEAQTRLLALASIEKAVGKAGDEAHGVVLAAMSAQASLVTAQADLAKAQARIAELEQGQEASTLDQAIAQAKADGKCTPAIEASVRESFAAKQVTLKGAQAWLAALPTIPALASKDKPPQEAAPGSKAAAVDLKHNGKTYDEMKPSERAALKKENPELFAAMRSASN